MVHVTLPSYTKHLMLTKNLKIFDLGIVPTVWYFLFFYLIWELFRQCGIFCFSIWFGNCSDSVVFLRNCSNSVVFFVFLFDLGIVPTVWYFLFFYLIWELFRQCGIFCFSIWFGNCSTVWYFLFFILLLDCPYLFTASDNSNTNIHRIDC